jgi:CyaY protein
MTETEFLQHAGQTLDAIEAAVDAAGADIESARTGNVLTLELADGSRVVINTQAPMRQIWVAARGGAYHYAWVGAAWRDTRDGSELFAALSRLISGQAGQAVVLRAPR